MASELFMFLLQFRIDYETYANSIFSVCVFFYHLRGFVLLQGVVQMTCRSHEHICCHPTNLTHLLQYIT